MKAVLRYFTGTGNTARVMDIVTLELEKAGYAVDSSEYPGPSFEASAIDLLVLGYPVLGFAPPEAFRRWLDTLPVGQNTKVALVCACGATSVNGNLVQGESANSFASLERILKRKSYKVVHTSQVSLPENWTQMMNTPSQEEQTVMFAFGDTEARTLGIHLAQEKFSKQKRSLILIVLTSLVAWLFSKVARRVLGKLYVADSQCSSCGLCARTCPGACIRMRSGRPVWNLDCSACNRCINICPEKAIQTSLMRLVLHGGLNIIALFWSILNAFLPLRMLGLEGLPFAVPLAVFSATCMFLFVTALQLGPLDFLVSSFERTKTGSRVSELSWTKSNRRYTAPGWKPKSRVY